MKLISRLSAAAFCLGLLVPSVAQAQSPAEDLFRQALDEMRSANFVTACPKLEESQRLEPKSGTLISLAFCNERMGKTATAWRNYRDAAALAKEEGRDEYVTKANELAAQLVPKLSNLRIYAPKIEGMVVEVDGQAVKADELGADIHVDPGKYTIVARAPGRETFTKTADVAVQQRETITIPELAHTGGITLVEPPVTQPAPTSSDGGGNGATIAGWTLVGVGGAATVVGFVLGGLVLGKKSTVDEECDVESRTCSQEGLDARDAGSTLSLGSTVAVIGGLAVAGAGVTVLLVTSSDDDGDVALTAGPTFGGAAIGLRGSF